MILLLLSIATISILSFKQIFVELVENSNAKKKMTPQKERKGQSTFRKKILQAYNYSCAITQENQKEVLEAAHIQTYISEDSNNIQNGLCLRVDIHKLFDNGLITINQDYKIILSSFLSSSNYKKLDNKKIILPAEKNYYPSLEALNYHYKYIFRK